jgi:opacity protein-like surface antigen
MKLLGIAALVVFAAAPAFAQEAGGVDARGYVSAFGGAAWGGGNSTGSVLFEGGARVAPHVMIFTNLGRFADLKGDLQPTLDAATTTLNDQGVDVSAAGKLPAWYGVGGVRAEVGSSAHALPYVLGGVGFARLTPSAALTFSGGTMPDGSTPDVGADVTTSLTSSGSFTLPAASTSFMTMLGGGVQVPFAPHWAGDVGYRYSHIAADSPLSAGALNTNVVTFGVGYRF